MAGKVGRPKKDVPVVDDQLAVKVKAVEKWTKEEMEEIAAENAALVKQSQFSDRQIRFLDAYLSENSASCMDIGKSITQAGYKSISGSSRATLGRMILNKYESSTEHDEIMRKMGFGEIWIINRLALLATQAKAESVQFQALNTLAKCIGMQRDVEVGGSGVEINIHPTESLPARQVDPKKVEIEISASQD